MSIYEDDDELSIEGDALPLCRSIYPVIPNKLRIIVLYNIPWTAVPGAAANPTQTEINTAPASGQIPVSPGLPWPTQLIASPLTIGTPVERRLNHAASVVLPGWNRTYNVPQEVVAKFGGALKGATSFVFDFGRRTKRESTGKLVAYSKPGQANAEVTFEYSWNQHGPVSDVTFRIITCVARNARFIVLSTFNDFLPQDGTDFTEPFIPIVVLGLQQWRASEEELANSVADARDEFYPTCCTNSTLDCMTLRAFSNFSGACGARRT